MIVAMSLRAKAARIASLVFSREFRSAFDPTYSWPAEHPDVITVTAREATIERKRTRLLIIARNYIVCRSYFALGPYFAASWRVQRFHTGQQLPNLLKRKTSEDIVWGSSGKDAIYLHKLRRFLSKAAERDRKILLSFAQKMTKGIASRRLLAFRRR